MTISSNQTERNSIPLDVVWLFLIALVVYLPFLLKPQFVWDDVPLIAENPLLKSWKSLPSLLSSGYWEGAVGAGAPVQEYRPLVMLSYFFTARLFGLAPFIFRITNIFLHAGNAALLFLFLKRRQAARVAWAAAVFFVVLPVNADVAGVITGRSESLMLLFTLLAWLDLDRHRRLTLLNGGCLALALLSKESAVLFPIVWFLADWTFYGRRFFDPQRVRTFLGMDAIVLAYIALRSIVLSRVFHGGHDYFLGHSYGIRLLTVSRFLFKEYFVTLATGLRFRIDYAHPLIPNASAYDPGAWIALACGIGLLAGSGYFLIRKRSAAAFWVMWAFCFWLPTSNLIVPLDTLGANRFLYVPAVGFCVLLSQALFRRPVKVARPFFIALVIWYGTLANFRSRLWATPFSLAEWVARTNPNSTRGWLGLADYYREQHSWDQAHAALQKAKSLDPSNPVLAYTAGLLAYDQRDFETAKKNFQNACAMNPADPDSCQHLATIAEMQNEKSAAIQYHLRVLAIRPQDAASHYDLGHLFLETGNLHEAVIHYQAFLELTPEDPDAPAIRSLLAAIHRDNPGL